MEKLINQIEEDIKNYINGKLSELPVSFVLSDIDVSVDDNSVSGLTIAYDKAE